MSFISYRFSPMLRRDDKKVDGKDKCDKWVLGEVCPGWKSQIGLD